MDRKHDLEGLGGTQPGRGAALGRLAYGRAGGDCGPAGRRQGVGWRPPGSGGQAALPGCVHLRASSHEASDTFIYVCRTPEGKATSKESGNDRLSGHNGR